MTKRYDIIDSLEAKGMRFLGSAGPERLVVRHGTDLVALTEDGKTELWRHALPGQAEGWIHADEHTVLWNSPGESWLVIAVDPADGRQRYALEGERSRLLDGDRFLSKNQMGMGFLRRTASGEPIAPMPALSAEGGYVFSPDKRWLFAGCQRVQVWDMEEVRLRFTFDSDVTAQHEFTPDGTGLVVTTIMAPQSGMQDEITQRTFNLRTGSLLDTKSWWERQ